MFPSIPPGAVAVACQAMATRFEIIMHGENPTALRAAGEEALEEVRRLETRLNLYQPASEIARVNARAHLEPVRVSPPVFRLLETAHRLHTETGGAFDISIGPLLRCWDLMDGPGSVPSPNELAAARACAGLQKVHLDPEHLTVRFEKPGLMLDLGAIGKGHAVEVAADILRQAGVTSAFIHGGTSSSYAIGQPPGQPAWKVALELPSSLLPAAAMANAGPAESGRSALPFVVPALAGPAPRPHQEGDLAKPGPARARHAAELAEGRTPFAVVSLADESLSVSAVWGKSFQAGARTYGHVIDPRTGAPTRAALLSAVVLRSATEADALSTALLVLGPEGQSQLRGVRPGMKSVVVHRQGETLRIETAGLALLS